MSPALLLACQPCTRSSRLLAACTPSAVLAVMIPMPTGILPRSDRSSLWIASLGISVRHVRAHNTELCCKRHLCDNHCSMVQPDVRRGGRPGVQTLLLQAHAAGGGALESAASSCFAASLLQHVLVIGTMLYLITAWQAGHCILRLRSSAAGQESSACRVLLAQLSHLTVSQDDGACAGSRNRGGDAAMNGGSLALYVAVEVLFKAAQILHGAHAPHAQRGRSCCLLGSRLCQHRGSAAVAVRGVQPLPPARQGRRCGSPS